MGPSLPDMGSDNSDDDFLGPALPPDMASSDFPNKKVDSDICSDGSESEDDGVIGPLPPTEEQERRAKLSVEQEFEMRNKKMKDKLTKKDDAPVKREAWMTELPDLVRKNFGMVARGFRQDAGPTGEGRSEWTDTPADKERRRQEAAEGKRNRNSSDDSDSERKKKKKKKKHKREREREEKIQKEVEKYNEKKRGESLMEIHQKKLQKKKEKEAKEKNPKPKERVPFSREVDLEVNKFDDAKRNRIIKQSAQLNNRFSHGATTSSFL